MVKLVCYYRVSCEKQGQSGLGLAGQRTAVEQYAHNTGGQILAEYTEVESGKLTDRPQLLKALAHARGIKATLCIAKLDRLARHVGFVSSILDSGVSFVCCDNPHANRLTLEILSVIAADESRRISERTKAAMAEAKKRGQLFGAARPNHRRSGEYFKRSQPKAIKAAAIANRQRVMDAYGHLLPTVKQLRDSGLTLNQIADHLNGDNHRTTRCLPFSATAVHRLLGRAC
jgi:DNA invertase Pin-like site-specific DNA recombinase